MCAVHFSIFSKQLTDCGHFYRKKDFFLVVVWMRTPYDTNGMVIKKIFNISNGHVCERDNGVSDDIDFLVNLKCFKFEVFFRLD